MLFLISDIDILKKEGNEHLQGAALKKGEELIEFREGLSHSLDFPTGF